MIEIKKEKVVFKDKLVVEEGEIQFNETSFSRQRINRPDAVAVLIINTESQKIVLTRQFRYAIAGKTDELILELVAGKIDEGEEPFETAKRETREETGYEIKEGNLGILLSCFVTPGYSSEQFILYQARVTNRDKVSKGGGLAEENEFIETIEVPIDEFIYKLKHVQLHDAKTYLAGLFALVHKIIP